MRLCKDTIKLVADDWLKIAEEENVVIYTSHSYDIFPMFTL